MANLEYSKDLIPKVSNLKMTNELKVEVDRYIDKNKNDKGISNIMFRNNLHYIIDNITKETLLSELKILNDKIEKNC